MTSSVELYPALAQRAESLARAAQLGLKDGAGNVQPSPLMLAPWQMSGTDFAAACDVARGIGQRMAGLALQPSRLQAALNPLLGGQSLPARLWNVWQDLPVSARRARPLSLIRVDLLQAVTGAWQLVEANSIAAGMGPFSAGLAQLQQQMWPDLQHSGLAGTLPEFAPNPVAHNLAQAMHSATLQQHKANAGIGMPTVVFVVDQAEDNIFDQNKIADALARLGSRVVRLTLAEIDGLLDRQRAPACVLHGIGEVQLFYFRTGYNLTDYLNSQSQDDRLLHLRAELETLHVTLAPNIPLQLASAKAVQVYWAQNAGDGPEQPALATAQFFLNDQRLARIQDWSNWLLKSQGEGGGNVVQGDNIPLRIRALHAAEKGDWILMRRIEARVRAGLLPELRNGKIRLVRDLISELGIFVVGDDLVTAGYLARSKSFDALEAGVHRGQGAIDAVAFY